MPCRSCGPGNGCGSLGVPLQVIGKEAQPELKADQSGRSVEMALLGSGQGRPDGREIAGKKRLAEVCIKMHVVPGARLLAETVAG